MEQPDRSVYNLFQVYNEEILWCSTNNSYSDQYKMEKRTNPRDVNSCYGTIGPSQDAVDMFFMANGLDIDGEVFFCGLTHEELTGMVGKQTGEDFTVESVGEPYQVEAHPKSQEPSQPRLAEKAKETRDGSDKLEQDSHDGQTPEREVERADGDAEH